MFYITIPYFNLDHIYNSGQAIGWKKVNDGKYIITHKNKIVQVTQKKENFSFTCSEESFYEIWYDYFDLGLDYSLLFNFYRVIDKEDLKPMCNRCRGLHILNQDLFRVIIYSIFMEEGNLTCKDAHYYCDLFASKFGKKRKSTIIGNVVTWYEFPSAESILKKQNKFNEDKMFDRYKHSILDICNLIKDDWLDLDFLKLLAQNLQRKEICEYLKDLGFTNRQIRQINILGLHILRCFIYDNDVDNFIKFYFQMSINDFIDWVSKSSKNELYSKNNIGYLYFILLYNAFCPIPK